MTDDIPDTGAVFTFGRSHFAENEPSHFFIKNDPVVAISCGDEHSAVICQNGRVFVFGGNAWGQLGLGHKDEVTRPSCVKWLKPHRAMFVACGRAHTVFVTDNNVIYSVGCNDEGQLGTGDMEHHTVPQTVELPSEPGAVKQVSAGSNHTAILTESGRVFVCGSNSEGQLGLGEDTRSSVSLTELSFMEEIAFVECGYYHTVFITAKGAVFVTGDNENQKLGIPNLATTVYVPEVIPIQTAVKSACCGANHTFLLSMDESKIIAFGSNEKGQLGMPKEIVNVATPTEIDMEKMFDGFQLKLVACGAMHTAFVTDNGLLYTCGESRHNKLCLEDIDDADNSNEVPNQYLPKRVTSMNGHIVDNVACGGCHTLLTATKGSNADFTNNDFNVINEETRQISLTELPPLQKVPVMSKTENAALIVEDVKNSNVDEHKTADAVNGNANEDAGSIDSLEANVSGSHIVNINDLEHETGSGHDIPGINPDEAGSCIPPIETEVDNALESMDTMADSINTMTDKMNKMAGTMVSNMNTMGSTMADNANSLADTMVSNTNKMDSTMADNANSLADTMTTKVNTITDKVTEKVEGIEKEVSDKVNEKVEVVEEVLKKTIAKSPKIPDDVKKVLNVPDKVMEIANSPPPKTPILPEIIHIPDIAQRSPALSKHSDDGQKSETGQSENETIPCGSDKSSPQTGKTKTQAVMPIVRSEDHIDSHEDLEHNEDGVVVKEKGRFARMFQSIKDKENSCMGKGKVIEEKVVENIHKGIDGAEETVHKIEQTVETEIRNQTNSRTCAIL